MSRDQGRRAKVDQQARADVSRSVVSATEWQTLQLVQIEARDSVTPERLQGTKPGGWGVVTDSYTLF